MRPMRRRPPPPDEPPRLVGRRCPNCRFKLVRDGADGKLALDRRVRVFNNEFGRYYQGELDAFNRQADEAARRSGKDSPEYRRLEALIAETWYGSVNQKMGSVVLECPKCRTGMGADGLDDSLLSRALTEAAFRSARVRLPAPTEENG